MLAIEDVITDLYYNGGSDNNVIYNETLDNGDVINHTKKMIIKAKIEELYNKINMFIDSSLADNLAAGKNDFNLAIMYTNRAKGILSRLQSIINVYYKDDANKFKL